MRFFEKIFKKKEGEPRFGANLSVENPHHGNWPGSPEEIMERGEIAVSPNPQLEEDLRKARRIREQLEEEIRRQNPGLE